MTWWQVVIDSANAAVDRLMDAALPLLAAYALYLVARLRRALLEGVPGWAQALVAAAIERALAPIVRNAVSAAEEHGARLMKEAIARGDELVKRWVTSQKASYARAYIKARVPDAVVSDQKIDQWIDAALVGIGRGATKGITIGVEYVEDKLREIPPPPAA